MTDDLRRKTRVDVCCRVVVHDRYGVWTAVTENVSVRGCLLVTSRLLRPGTTVSVTLSSDQFPEELEATGEAVWVSPERLGVSFTERATRPGALTPEEWLEKVIEHGGAPGTARIVPSVARAETRPVIQVAARNGRVVRTTPTPIDPVLRAPLRRA